MKKILFIAASFYLATLGGCALYTPGGAVVVDPAGVGGAAPASHGGGGFCPPGQAKKGNC